MKLRPNAEMYFVSLQVKENAFWNNNLKLY